MKFKVFITILIATACVIASMTCGLLSGFAIADNNARKSVDEDYVVLRVEHETGEHVKYIRYSPKYELLTLETYEGNTYHFELKKVAPFRYEWVYVEL